MIAPSEMPFVYGIIDDDIMMEFRCLLDLSWVQQIPRDVHPRTLRPAFCHIGLLQTHQRRLLSGGFHVIYTCFARNWKVLSQAKS